MPENLIWFVWSLGFLLLWTIVFLAYKAGRKRMIMASILTMPFGLTEPLFVPEYWNPPSLFDLAQTTGFDIESLIFCFAIGGLGLVLYDALFMVRHDPMSHDERAHARHRYHRLTLASPIIVFLLLSLATNWNAIYTGSISMFVAGLAALWCRPDLKKKIWLGGGMFLMLYFVYFFFLDLMSPGYIERVWSLGNISGVILAGIPLEEYLFAFTFGMLWSSYYEHITWKKIHVAAHPLPKDH